MVAIVKWEVPRAIVMSTINQSMDINNDGRVTRSEARKFAAALAALPFRLTFVQVQFIAADVVKSGGKKTGKTKTKPCSIFCKVAIADANVYHPECPILPNVAWYLELLTGTWFRSLALREQASEVLQYSFCMEQ